MSRANKVGTARITISLDLGTNEVLDKLATLGIFGKNKSEVAAMIIRMWTWDNEEKLSRHGVRLPGRGSS